MLALVASCQLQILVWCLSRFLNESVEQNHPGSLVDAKKHPRDSILREARPHFINAVTKGFANGHSDWPANSTVLISSPMRFRSSGGSSFRHARTGSPPASVR
jgi:hypothetical protein